MRMMRKLLFGFIALATLVSCGGQNAGQQRLAKSAYVDEEYNSAKATFSDEGSSVLDPQFMQIDPTADITEVGEEDVTLPIPIVNTREELMVGIVNGDLPHLENKTVTLRLKRIDFLGYSFFIKECDLLTYVNTPEVYYGLEESDPATTYIRRLIPDLERATPESYNYPPNLLFAIKPLENAAKEIYFPNILHGVALPLNNLGNLNSVEKVFTNNILHGCNGMCLAMPNLKQVDLSSSLQYVPDACFAKLPSLQTVMIVSAEYWGCAPLWREDKGFIGYCAFLDSPVEVLGLLSLAKAGLNAHCFEGTKVRTYLTTSEYVGPYAFARCYYLGMFMHGEGGFKSIGAYAFADTYSLGIFPIPESGCTIGQNAFIRSKVTERMVIYGDYLCLGNNIIRYLGNADEAYVPYDIDSIASHAFYNNEKLKRIHFGALTCHYSPLFAAYCPNLEEVTFGARDRLIRVEAGVSSFHCPKLGENLSNWPSGDNVSSPDQSDFRGINWYAISLDPADNGALTYIFMGGFALDFESLGIKTATLEKSL